MNHKLFLIFLLCLPIYVWGNSAQPGIWNAGGSGTFSLLYPADSISFKKIQMQREKVSIQLYKNYAVVKGEYWLVNTTEKPVELKVGYPVNSIFRMQHQYNRTDVEFDSLYQLSVFINEKSIEKTRIDSVTSTSTWQIANWYVWNMKFLPNDSALATVYFIVRTDNTIVSKGYTRNHLNGFIYILETGSIWKQPIEQGKITVELKDDISLKDIKGISPDSIFKVDKTKKILYYEFSNLSPTPLNNIIITYAKDKKEFDFKSILAQKELWYKNIDSLANTDLSKLDFKPQKFQSPFDVESGYFISFILLFIGIIIVYKYIVFMAILLIIAFIYVRKRKKN